MSFFSIVIPVFNREEEILRTLMSVAKQSFKDYECIIIDDGSTDNTSRVVKHFCRGRENFYYLKTENRGVSAARNLGVKLTSGKWLAFLDSDDEWLEHKLQTQFDYIERNPEFSLVHANENWLRNGVEVKQLAKHTKSGGDVFERATELCLISPSAVVLKRCLFESHGGFREDFEVCEDYDLWLRITSRNKIGFISEPLVNKYDGHQNQLSHKYKAMDEWRVKSLDYMLKTKKLTKSQEGRVTLVVKKKCEVLLKGYAKHSRLDKLAQMTKLYGDYFDSQSKNGNPTVKTTDFLARETSSEELPPLTVL